jgi:16S rRNA (uracil1498-N3)-methyltransferase
MFYVDEVHDARAAIEGETARHLRRVLRAEAGQRYEVSDNQSLYLAEIRGVGKEHIELKIIERLEPPPPAARIHLLPALIKFDHFEWMLEKATELGVERVSPIVAARSDKGLAEAALNRRRRWERILFESGQQSRRVIRPRLEEPLALGVLFETAPPEAGVRLFCDEAASAPAILDTLPQSCSRPDHVALVIGPEGGWEDQEREEAARSGWKAASLGGQTLRAETAAIAAIAIVNAAWNSRSG